MLSLALDAARATGGLVTPAAGGALVGAGYDRDFAVASPRRRRGRAGARPVARLALAARTDAPPHRARRARPERRRQGQTVDDALALVGDGWVSAGGDIATTVPLVVGLPGGDSITSRQGRSRDEQRRAAQPGAAAACCQHHLIDPATGSPGAHAVARRDRRRRRPVVAADVAAKAALLLGPAGPSWLDRRGLAGRFVDHRRRTSTVSERWLQARRPTGSRHERRPSGTSRAPPGSSPTCCSRPR